ncbi:flagellar hook-associated protein FlgL [Zafaria cholistanensis]|uniref:flagellar hook-associated protein FlgL n=1 Tax=Zafaria cholistanensis TaxID=1682741 RepID=UPI001230CE65|nr:flagellar hook-associated protein FlgL [Zafaria cholistanensis]
MFQRVTHQSSIAGAQQRLQTSQARYTSALEQATSQRRVAKPSDDPAATGTAMAARSGQRAAEQYGRNINDAQLWLGTLDSSLSSATDLLLRVRDLTLQAANTGVHSQESRDAIAQEIGSLRQDLLGVANTTLLGRNVFAGTSAAAQAFAGEPPVAAPAPGAVLRRVGEGQSVRVDADGAALFGSGAGSLFTLLDGLAAEIRSGAPVGGRLAELDARRQTLLLGQADVGARYAAVGRAADALGESTALLESTRSAAEDIELAEAALNLSSRQLSYQAALSATSKVLNTSLMDYLS